MEFGKSILHEDAAYYQLNNATIISGILTLKPGGSLKYTFTEADIARLTEYFRIALAPTPYTDRYVPQTLVRISVEMSTGEFYTDTLFPVEFPNGIYIQEIKLKAGEYKNFTFEIETKESISFSLWELCPEAADEDIQTVIEGVEQSLPRLLYDYNTWPLSVDSYEKTIALITYRLLDHTDLQGHFLMRYVASQACTLTLRFKDNGATELFAPLLYDLSAGRGSIEIPHAYLKRLAGIHAVTVTAQVTSGTLVVDTRGILFTIDGGYLAERMLDIGVDMRDISIRQLSQDYGPDEIWIVGIEAGEAIVRKRKYDSKATIGFEPVFSVGQAKEAAIEFDGDWVLRPDSENYTLETYESPWIIWIDKDDNLLAQLGNDEETRITLDTGASSPYVCRGYKSQLYPEQDQGVVVVYLKSSKVYYVQYAYDITAQYCKWSDPYEIDTELDGVVNVSINRLNDYRLGISVVLSNETRLYITNRTYVNQAVPRETAILSEPSRILFACYPANYDSSLKILSQEMSDDRLQLTFTVDKVLRYEGYNIMQVITFDDSVPSSYVKDIIMSVNEASTTFSVILNKRPAKLITNIHINAAQSGDLQERVHEYSYIVCPSAKVTFDITNYVSLTAPKETAELIAPINCGFAYIAKKKLTHTIEETAVLSAPSTCTYAYLKKAKLASNSSETAVLSSPSSYGFAYTAIVDVPI